MTRLIAIACLLITSFNAHSADLTVSGGQLMGATGVEVNGNLYDVEFLTAHALICTGGATAPLTLPSVRLWKQKLPRKQYWTNCSLVVRVIPLAAEGEGAMQLRRMVLNQILPPFSKPVVGRGLQRRCVS